jgi:membrane-associated protein
MGALASLRVDSALSYLIAVIIPALDAVFPVLPSETAVIALGVATAGSTDPRIALLVAAAAAGAFLGDNLSYLIGRRFGPATQRRFFSTPRGQAARTWAERSLRRFGTQLIIVCRFIPGGRTAVTLTCGLTGYPRGRFAAGTAAAAVIWALYAFFIGRLGGKAFEDAPWAGFLMAAGAAVIISALIEAARRIRARRPSRGHAGQAPSRGHAGQVEADDPGEHEADRHELRGRYRVAEPDHPDGGRPRGADPGPDRVGGPDLQLTQRDR